MAIESVARKTLPDTTRFRAAPHNIEVEQALLGAVLVNNEAFYRVSDFLAPQHFFEALHQKIYELASSLVRQGKVASPVTLKTFLPADLDIAGLNASQYLARLAAEATTVINAEDYGRTIYDLAIRRDLIVIGEDMVNVAYDAPVDLAPAAQIEDAERKLYEIAETGKYDGGFQRFAQALTTAVDMAAHAYQRDGKLSGISDRPQRPRPRRWAGCRNLTLSSWPGRPGMGKTALRPTSPTTSRKAWHGEVQADGRTATINGGIVGFFSLEMSAEQFATRIVSEQTGIASYRMRRGDIDPRRIRPYCRNAREIEALPLYIDETGGLSIAQLAARARRLKRQRGLDLIVVDYIQLLQGSTRRAAEGRVQEVTEITTSLKALAKELSIPIVALSQLSRQVENREDKRPQLSDLREFGLNRARRRRRDVCISRRILSCTIENRAPEPKNTSSGRRNGRSLTARLKSLSANNATDQPAPSRCNSRQM